MLAETETDEVLMAAYRAGDVRAFEWLLARHERAVWNFLRRFVPDASTAEDLLQEVFLRVVKGADEWRGTAKFSTWLYTIARNLTVDQARRAVHRRVTSLDGTGRPGDDGDEATLHDRLPASTPGADQRVTDQQIARRIEAAVSALPTDQREVFLMREVMDLPFAEIAKVVGASEPTVKSRMRYALEKLREALIDFQDGLASPLSAGTREGLR